MIPKITNYSWAKFAVTFLVSWIVHIHSVSSGSSPSFDTCDGDSIPSSTSVASLNHNTFYKICPGTFSSNNKQLGQPICGDGTAFSFFFTKPLQNLSNNRKILIEFQGGGACWDQDTCNDDNDELSFPQDLNNFVGYSCSALSYTDQEYNGYPINFLCDTEIGDVDFNEYNTVIVPYCTQDMHLGDNVVTYGNGDDDDGQNGNKVYHHGAHNVMGVLEWIFKNFPNPSHIALTGCSAGGSVLPVVYDLMYHHYNSLLKGGRSANINVMMDSPLYLTPQKFLYYGIDNWNLGSILGRSRFNLDRWEHDTTFSTKLWKHMISRGSKKDKWGFLSHSNDPVAEEYWEAMGGNDKYYSHSGGSNNKYYSSWYNHSSWYNDENSFVIKVERKYNNVDSFIINEEGHCGLGLYYGIQEAGFDSWAGAIFEEQYVLGDNVGLPVFLLSVAVGVICTYLIILTKLSELSRSSAAESFVHKIKRKGSFRNFLRKKSESTKSNMILSSIWTRFASCPITTGYTVIISLYFVLMLVFEGFTHPLDNPSLGPDATTLSSYGINNPTLVVYDKHLYRLISSPFLCSGVITYGMVMTMILESITSLESQIGNNTMFLIICCSISMGSNLCYTMFGEGASCGSLGFIVGLNAFSISSSFKFGDLNAFPSPWVSTLLFGTLGGLLPFNHWLVIFSAAAIGIILSVVMVRATFEHSSDVKFGFKFNHLVIASIVFFILLVMILLAVPNPNKVYERPYFTGCKMMVSNDIENIVFSDYDERALEGNNANDDNNKNCAQFCVPNIIQRSFYSGVGRYTEYSMQYGTCEDYGYITHMEEKTVSYFSYDLDVDLYSLSYYGQ